MIRTILILTIMLLANPAIAQEPVLTEAQAWQRLQSELQVERRSYLIMWPGNDEGLLALEKYLEQYPNSPHRCEVLYMRAIGLWNLYRYKEAAEAYDRFIKACPDEQLAILAMTRQVQSLVRSDQPEKAIEAYGRYRKNPAVDQRTPAYLDAMLLQGKVADVRLILEEMIKASDSGVAPSRSIDMLESKLRQIEMVGKPLPGFEVQTLKGNSSISPESFRGQILLIEFWASWCKPCVSQMHFLTRAYDEFHPQGFEILGVNLDEELAILEPVMGQLGMKWPQFADGLKWGNKLAVQFEVRRIPYSLLVDRKGIVRYVNVPPAAVARLVEELLGSEEEMPSP
ncbi:MAG: redoxin domain-containing protein [Phycisphaerales bacterium]|nr:redoxin domain-containing protein [Phycisphaerales bacterium]